jgi:hypothetical protein
MYECCPKKRLTIQAIRWAGYSRLEKKLQGSKIAACEKNNGINP